MIESNNTYGFACKIKVIKVIILQHKNIGRIPTKKVIFGGEGEKIKK
jgi:hypothetical protein